jgi:hypothetical protein
VGFIAPALTYGRRLVHLRLAQRLHGLLGFRGLRRKIHRDRPVAIRLASLDLAILFVLLLRFFGAVDHVRQDVAV